MKFLEKIFDAARPTFEKGGKLAFLYPLYEAIETFALVQKKTTKGTVHLRDAVDFKRLMMAVVYALIPCAVMGMYNVGYQANAAMHDLGRELSQLEAQFAGNFGLNAWLLNLIAGLWPSVFDAQNILGCLIHGAVYFVPMYVVTMAVGLAWEILFAAVRKHEVNEGFFVTGLLFPLTLPPTIPLWQIAVGISFGVIFAKEVFGGTGRNFLNPALCARAFLFFAYAAQISGDRVWVACDGYSSATALSVAWTDGVAKFSEHGITALGAFVGIIPGSFGETSTLACLLGLVMLAVWGIASLRIMLSVAGTVLVLALLFSGMAGEGSAPMMSVGPYWHFVLGGMAFGTIFMATDPVTASMTKTGQILYGIVIGAVMMVVRVFNPAFPEGMMLAILLGNVTAPLIDHYVVQANVKRRQRRLQSEPRA